MGYVLAFPVVAVWRLLELLVSFTGRLLALGLGLTFVVVGMVLTVTVIGAFLGIPLALLGVLLMVRAIL